MGIISSHILILVTIFFPTLWQLHPGPASLVASPFANVLYRSSLYPSILVWSSTTCLWDTSPASPPLQNLLESSPLSFPVLRAYCAFLFLGSCPIQDRASQCVHLPLPIPGWCFSKIDSQRWNGQSNDMPILNLGTQCQIILSKGVSIFSPTSSGEKGLTSLCLAKPGLAHSF